MRVMLDTKVWVDLKEERQFLDEFRELYNVHELVVVFSHGNFLDLVRRDEQDELATIIDEFTDEYLGPFQPDQVGSYHQSNDPLVLARIDEQWYQYISRVTQHHDDAETLKAMFRDADFDAAPVATVLEQFIEGLRQLDHLEPNGRIDVPDDVTQSVALKKVGIFPEYRTQLPDGKFLLDDANVPLKRYVFGMSMIYISETYHEPEVGDYRDAIIWSQAISCDCDALWTEVKWTYEHPVIRQVLDRLDRKPLAIVQDFSEFNTLLD